jgi:hypothetical protein
MPEEDPRGRQVGALVELTHQGAPMSFGLRLEVAQSEPEYCFKVKLAGFVSCRYPLALSRQ